MPARLSAFVIWAMVAVAAMFWGLRLLALPIPVPPNAMAVNASQSVRGDLSRLLGAEQQAEVDAAPPADNRFQLVGVMAARPAAQGSTAGVALISVDGKPARPFVSGAQVEGSLVLQTVSQRSASLGPADGVPSMVLEIPSLPAPATGTLPGGEGMPPNSSPVVQAPAPANAIPPPRQAMPRAVRPPPAGVNGQNR